MHDAMLAAIFKAVHEDTVPDSYVGLDSTAAQDKMGCGIPRFIKFRSLPVNVQDDLTCAEILPIMWPKYKVSGYERVVHYRLMTVIRRAMVAQATCHELTAASLNSMYPPSVDEQYRAWIKDLIHVPGGHPVTQIQSSSWIFRQMSVQSAF